MNTPQTVIFIGPQGSGKGTQILKLKDKLQEQDPGRKVVDIQTGRRFRAMAARGESYTEQRVADTLDTGTLQPLFLSVGLWADAMRYYLDESCHLLVDGFPRVVAEAQVLESVWSFYKRDRINIINLKTPEDVVRTRMQERAREDDTETSIEERLGWYRDKVIPVIDYYREHDRAIVYDVDGTDTVEGVHAAVISALDLQ